jgi:hypothetical protein
MLSIAEISKNSQKKNIENVKLQVRFNVCNFINDGKVSLKARQPFFPILFPQK